MRPCNYPKFGTRLVFSIGRNRTSPHGFFDLKVTAIFPELRLSCRPLDQQVV